MCQKRKINQVSAVHGDDNPNEIFDKYQVEFGYLLNPKAGGHGPSGAEWFYYPDDGIKEKLKNILFPMNSITMLIGGKGQGKTSAIENAFECRTSQIQVLRDYIVVPMFFRRWITDKATDGASAYELIFRGLVKTVKAACEELEYKYPDLRAWINGDEGKNALLSMIKGTNPRASVNYDVRETTESLTERLDAAYKEEPLIYMASLLKMYLSTELSTVHRLLLIVDDIESIKEELFESIIAQILRLYECMANLPKDWQGEREYINLLFSLRPESYKRLCKLDVLSNYSGFTVIKKWQKFDLFDYFFRKQEVLSGDVKENSTYRWTEAMTILRTLCSKYEGKYNNMIMGLAEHDVRQALYICQKILRSTWTAMDPFTDKEELGQRYGFNNISIIRSIACGDNLVYMPDEESIIPNILENTETEDNSVIALYIMSYFAPKDEKQKKRDPITENKERFLEQFNDVFGLVPEHGRDSGKLNADTANALFGESQKEYGKTFSERLLSTIERLKAQGVLIEDDNFITMTVKGREIWNMLQADSVLFEVFREDRYRYADDSNSNALKSSQEITAEGSQSPLFHELIEDLRKNFWSEEKNYISAVIERGGLRKYADLFGITTMTGLLLKGIKCSIDFSGRYSDPAVFDNWRSLSNEINMHTGLQPPTD